MRRNDTSPRCHALASSSRQEGNMIALAALRAKTASTTAHHDLRGRTMAEVTDCTSPAIRDALNWLEYGVLVVNADARVSFVNSRAQELLSAEELVLIGGQLRTGSFAQTALLHELIGRYARRTGETLHRPNGNYHWVG